VVGSFTTSQLRLVKKKFFWPSSIHFTRDSTELLSISKKEAAQCIKHGAWTCHNTNGTNIKKKVKPSYLNKFFVFDKNKK
jgi:hypothetical protein